MAGHAVADWPITSSMHWPLRYGAVLNWK